MMFGSVHSRLGGNIRLLISGGAALPSDTQSLFGGLGLHLSEGYGLTEASPVLTVSQAGPGRKTAMSARRCRVSRSRSRHPTMPEWVRSGLVDRT